MLTPISTPQQGLGHVRGHFWLEHPRGFPHSAWLGCRVGPDLFCASFPHLGGYLTHGWSAVSPAESAKKEKILYYLYYLPSDTRVSEDKTYFAAQPSHGGTRPGRQVRGVRALSGSGQPPSLRAVTSNALSLGMDTVSTWLAAPLCGSASVT